MLTKFKTLEQEMTELTESREYVVRMVNVSYLHVHVIYAPSFRMSKDNSYIAANGEIALKLFGGPFRFKRAGRWVRRTIRRHQAMLREMGPVRLV